MIIIVIVLASLVFEVALLWWVVAKIYIMATNPDEVNREFFSVCPPNKIIIVMRGVNPNRYISNCRGFDVDEETGMLYFINEKDPKNKEFIKLDPATGKIERPERFQSLSAQTFTGLLDELWGIHYLGIPPMGKLYSFTSEWNDVTKMLSSPSTPNQERGEEVDFGFVARKKRIASFSVMMNAGWVIKNCETGKGAADPTLVHKPRPDMVAIDFFIFSTIVIVNVNQAFIMTKWTEGVDAIIRRVCTAYSGKYNTDNLGEDGGALLIEMLWKANAEILEKYGVAFYNLAYNGWDYSGTPEEKAEIRRQSRLVWLSKQQAEAKKNETDAAAYDIEKKGDAQAKALEAVGNAQNKVRNGRVEGFKQMGDQAGAIAVAEAMPDVKPGVTLSFGGALSILAQTGKGGKNETDPTAVK